MRRKSCVIHFTPDGAAWIPNSSSATVCALVMEPRLYTDEEPNERQLIGHRFSLAAAPGGRSSPIRGCSPASSGTRAKRQARQARGRSGGEPGWAGKRKGLVAEALLAFAYERFA